MNELEYTLLALVGLACQVSHPEYPGYHPAIIKDGWIRFVPCANVVVLSYWLDVINIAVNVDGITLTLRNGGIK